MRQRHRQGEEARVIEKQTRGGRFRDFIFQKLADTILGVNNRWNRLRKTFTENFIILLEIFFREKKEKTSKVGMSLYRKLL